MKSFIIVFGKPNAGKGTRLNYAKKELQFEVISVGDLLRQEVKNQTPLGMEAKSYMDQGALVPDNLINSMVIENLKQSDHIISDGYPRTANQALAMLDSGVFPDMVINLQVPDDIIIQRASDRLVCSNCGEIFTKNDFKKPQVDGVCDKCHSELIQRADDNPDVIIRRLKTFEEETLPVLKVLDDAGIIIYNIDNTSIEANKNFINLLKKVID